MKKHIVCYNLMPYTVAVVKRRVLLFMSDSTDKKPQSAKKQKDTKINKFIKSGGRSNALSDFDAVLKRAAKSNSGKKS